MALSSHRLSTAEVQSLLSQVHKVLPEMATALSQHLNAIDTSDPYAALLREVVDSMAETRITLRLLGPTQETLARLDTTLIAATTALARVAAAEEDRARVKRGALDAARAKELAEIAKSRGRLAAFGDIIFAVVKHPATQLLVATVVGAVMAWLGLQANPTVQGRPTPPSIEVQDVATP